MKIVVGYAHEMEDCAEVRSPQQRETVRGIIESDDFDFAVNNPFTEDVADYVGPFSFVYYTTDGTLHAKRIGKLGKVLQQAEARR